MRVNLSARLSGNAASRWDAAPVLLTVRPACRIPGDYEYATDSNALLRLLRRETDLPGYVLDVFEKQLRAPLNAQLLGVELSDSVLTDIGYFVD